MVSEKQKRLNKNQTQREKGAAKKLEAENQQAESQSSKILDVVELQVKRRRVDSSADYSPLIESVPEKNTVDVTSLTQPK